MLMFGYLNSRSPEPRNPEMRVSPFLFFMHFGSLYMLMFGTGTREVPNPEILKCGSHLSFFAFQKFVYVDVGHWNSRSSEPRNPEMRVSPFFFSHFGSSYMLKFGALELMKFEPRNPEALVQPSLCFTFRRFVSVDVWLLYSRNPELRNPEVLVTFRNFGSCCVLMLAVVFAKSRTPKSRNAGHFSRFRELLCVDVGCCTREIPNSEIPTCWSLFAISGVVVC
jgi:hypothetical protein